MIILIDIEKMFDKIERSFTKKAVNKIRNRREIPQLGKRYL